MDLQVEEELDEDGFLILNFIRLKGRKGGPSHNIKHTIYISSNVPYHQGVRMGIVEGNVRCGTIDESSYVTSLLGFPESVEGNLVLSYSNLEDFTGMPKYIKGKIWFLGGSVNHFRGFTQDLSKLHASNDIKATKGYKAYKLLEMLGGKPK
jgi:hypothetical protein